MEIKSTDEMKSQYEWLTGQKAEDDWKQYFMWMSWQLTQQNAEVLSKIVEELKIPTNK